MRAHHRTGRIIASIAAAALLLTACGGGDSAEPAEEPSDDVVAEPAETDGDDTVTDESVPDDAVTDETATDDTAADDTAADEPATFEPGPVEYRLVNLTDDPVDVYVRTQGFVQAFEIDLGVAPGAVTDLIAPPADGTFLVTTAGAGDPECVGTCDHVLVSLTAFPDDGPIHTVLLYDADGSVQAFDLWESPTSDTGNANAMVAADPTIGRFVVTAVDVTDADFGLRLGLAGSAGCVEPVNLQNVLVGGNQTPAFEVAGGAVDVLLFDNRDQECVEAPVGGPFRVVGDGGSRTHLILTVSPGALDAIVLPFAGEVVTAREASDGSSEGASEGADRDTAIALMADELAAEIGLPADEATCLAPYVVDAIGVGDALVDGELIDLDAADTATQDLAFEGLLAGVEACGIDPNSLGG